MVVELLPQTVSTVTSNGSQTVGMFTETLIVFYTTLTINAFHKQCSGSEALSECSRSVVYSK